jgi:cobalt-zinc-cadmium efflux system outer membrane protein
VSTGPSYTMSDGSGWMVMVGISIPLWRGKLRAGVNAARAMVDMTNADLEAMRRMIGGQATAARERVTAARARYLALRDNIIPRAKQTISPTLAAYAASQTPLVSAIEAAQALWDAQRELAMARAELGLAWARLSRTTGETP